MKIAMFVIAIIGCLAHAGFGDSFEHEWGVVSSEESSLGPVEALPEAPAVILFDVGRATTEFRGMTYTRHLRFKVLDPERLGGLANDSIDYYSYDHFYGLKAQIIHADGSKAEIDKHSFEVQESGDRRVCHLAFDSLKSGDIVEYQYSIDYYGGYDKLGPEVFFVFSQERPYASYKARRNILADMEWDQLLTKQFSDIPTWFFDHRLYCRHSEFMAKLGADLDYFYYGTNIPPELMEPVSARIKVLTATAYRTHTWTIADIPPIGDTTAAHEAQRTALHFLLFSTVGQNRVIQGTFDDKQFQWIGESMQGYLDEYVKVPRGFGKLSAEIIGTAATDSAKVDAIYAYVDTAFVTDSTGYVLRPSNRDLQALWRRKKGAPFEITIALVELLKKAGLQAWPVIISTTDKVQFQKSGRFNHMIAMVQLASDTIFLDVSAGRCPPGTLSDLCRPENGVIVDYDASRICPITAVRCDP